MAEEFGRPGTWRSKVGWEAIEEPWTNRIVAFAVAGSTAHLFHKNSFTSPLLVQCSTPANRWVVSFMERSFLARLRSPGSAGIPPALPGKRGTGGFMQSHGLGHAWFLGELQVFVGWAKRSVPTAPY